MCESQVEIEIPGPDPGGQPCDSTAAALLNLNTAVRSSPHKHGQ